MIVLFTDYGVSGPYLGQVEMVLQTMAPDARVVNLLADAPRNDPKHSAYLLSAYTKGFPDGAVFFCVVDPGVGSQQDNPVMIRVNESWFVGPDNGLFDMLLRENTDFQCWKINWQPGAISDTFHGRDLYAPVCAKLAQGEEPPGEKIQWQDRHAWPDDLAEIIYTDHFGNAITGTRAATVNGKIIQIGNIRLANARTFSLVEENQAFWYENSNGLVEIAINKGSARQTLGLDIGSKIEFVT